LLLQDFESDIMACTPSYALTLADALLDEGVNPADLPVRSFILGAEPWTDAMREEVEAKLHVDAVNIYGLSEIIGPGVSNECVEAKDGMHLMEDHFLAEIIDRNHRSREWRAIGRWRSGRASLHHIDQTGHAAAPLSDRRHLFHQSESVYMWSYPCPHEPHSGSRR